jgi:hypothetical protein
MNMESLVFLAVSLVFTCFYFIKKSTLFSVIGGGLWFVFIIYEYMNSTGWDVYRGLALIGTLMAILSWTMPLTWRSNPVEEEPEEEEYIDSINRQREELITASRKSRRKEEF